MRKEKKVQPSSVSPAIAKQVLGDVFCCDDCKRTMPVAERCDEDLDVCKSCADMYLNETGHCSAYCRVTGQCDGAC